MKCLVIDGGPRMGNTWELTELVREDLKKLNPAIVFDELHLKDLHLPFCLGCSLCFRKGHTNCPHHEIVQQVMTQIQASDGVIFTMPTYNMHVPAMVKNLMDHLCFLLHRPRYYDKVGLVISTTGGVGARKTTSFLAGTATGWGFNRCYQLPIASASWNAYQPGEKHRKKAEKAAKKFYQDLSSRKLRPPSLSTLIPYNLFRGMSPTYRPGTAYASYDGMYWEEAGLADTTYFPKVPLPLHKKAFGNLFYHLGKVMSGRMIVTYKK